MDTTMEWDSTRASDHLLSASSHIDRPTSMSRTTDPKSIPPGSRQLGKMAGSRTWKSWAARSSGPDGYRMGDLMSGMKHQFRKWGRGSSLPDCCPICFDEPAIDDWHTLWCGCSTS